MRREEEEEEKEEGEGEGRKEGSGIGISDTLASKMDALEEGERKRNVEEEEEEENRGMYVCQKEGWILFIFNQCYIISGTFGRIA